MNSGAAKVPKLIDRKAAEICNVWFADLREKWRKKSDQKLRALKKHRKEKKDLLSLLVKSLLKKPAIGKHDLDSLLHRVRTQEYSIFDFFLEVSSLEESVEGVLRGSDEIREADLLDGMNLVHKKLSAVFGKILKQTSEIYEYIAESEGRGFCQVDKQGKITFANEEMKRLLRIRSVTGKHLDSYFKGEEKHFVREALSGKLGKTPQVRRLELIADGGKSSPVGAEVAPIVIGGQKTGGYACMVDLSGPVKAERAIFDKSPLGITRVNLKGQITYLNRKATEVLGMEKWEGMTLRDVFPDEENYGKVLDQLKKRERGLSSEYEAEITRVNDKKRVPVMISASPEKDLKGNPIGSLAIVRNIALEKVVEAIHEHIEASRDGQELLTAVAKETEKIIPFQYFGAALYTDDMRHVRALSHYLPSGQLEIQRRWWEVSPHSRKFLKRRKTILGNLDDFLAQEKWKHLKADREFKKILDAGFNAFMYYPVREGDRLVGSITLYSRAKNAFDKNHVKSLEALPLDKALLTAIHYEERKDLEFRLNLIKQISSASNNVQEVGEIIVSQLADQYGWNDISLYAINEVDGVIRLLSQQASSKAFRLPKDYKQRVDEGILGYVYRNKVAVNVGNVRTAPKFKRIYKEVSPPTLSELCLPISVDGKVCWLLNVQDSVENAFSEEEKKAMEGVLKEVSEFLQRSWMHHFINTTLQSASDAIIVTDNKGIINQVYPAATKLLGFSKAELIGSALVDYVLDADPDEAVLRAETLPSNEVSLRCNTGDRVNVLLSAAPLPERVGGKVFIAKDLFFQKRVEELEYLGKMYYELSAQTTTPLALALSWLNRLKSESQSITTTETLDKAIRQLHKVRLTYDRLSLYDKEKETLPYDELLFDIPELLDSVLSNFPKTEAKKIDRHVEEGMPYLRGDLFQLSFCLESILSYLLRFAPEDEKIELRVSQIPDWLRIEICGFFPGLPGGKFEETANKTLVSRTLTEMALGEEIIKKFVSNHKGIFHEPEREGKIMKFRIDLRTLTKGH
jgi:PAS domain S-box-containing protein